MLGTRPSKKQLHGNGLVANFTGKCLLNETQVDDSGALDHMVGINKILSEIEHTSTYKHVEIHDRSTLRASHIGKCEITLNIKLTDVIVILGFQCNLLSIIKATCDLNCSIALFLDSCIFFGPTYEFAS